MEKPIKTNAYIVPFSITGSYSVFKRNIKLTYGKAYKVLFTIVPNDENMDVERFEEIVRRFGDTAVKQLRRSDLMMQSKNNQFLLLLPVLDDKYVNVVIQRIKLRFFRSGLMNEVSLLHTAEIADFSRTLIM